MDADDDAAFWTDVADACSLLETPHERSVAIAAEALAHVPTGASVAARGGLELPVSSDQAESALAAAAFAAFEARASVASAPSDGTWHLPSLPRPSTAALVASEQAPPSTSRVAVLPPLGPRGACPIVRADTPLAVAALARGVAVADSPVDWAVLPPSLLATLLPFQRDGVAFGLARGGRVLIGDEMGLGKTVQAIALAAFYRSEWPVLVLAPPSLRALWRDSFLRFLPDVLTREQVQVLRSNSARHRDALGALVVIVSYSLVARCAELLHCKGFRVVILDESHAIKNAQAKRTRAIVPLAKAATRLVLLSGTPMLSRPKELFVQLHVLRPALWPSFGAFARRYCGGTADRFGQFSGASNLAELGETVRAHVMIRREKAAVLTQLPAKLRQVVYVPPRTAELAALSRMQDEYAARTVARAERLGASAAVDARDPMLTQMFLQTARVKIPAVRAFIGDLADAGAKFLVFAHHAEMISAICDTLSLRKTPFILIDGSTATAGRYDLVQRFQTEPDVLAAVLSITAAGVGLTLTAAATVVFAELHWTPGALLQAEDRAHRIGQKSCVNVTYLLCRSTLDDLLWPLLVRKTSLMRELGMAANDELASATAVASELAPSLSPSALRKITDPNQMGLREAWQRGAAFGLARAAPALGPAAPGQEGVSASAAELAAAGAAAAVADAVASVDSDMAIVAAALGSTRRLGRIYDSESASSSDSGSERRGGARRRGARKRTGAAEPKRKRDGTTGRAPVHELGGESESSDHESPHTKRQRLLAIGVEEARAVAAAREARAPWTCADCTFINESTLASCAICSAVKPTAVSAKPSVAKVVAIPPAADHPSQRDATVQIALESVMLDASEPPVMRPRRSFV